MPESYARIRFNLDPEDWHGETAELLWAEPIGPQGSRVFRLMNSPYHAHGVSYLDIVRAEEAPDGMGLDYAGTIEASGHSTIWLLVPSDSAVFARHWSSLHSRGCTYEGVVFDSKQTLYSVDVPPEANFAEIVSILDEGHRRGAWLFQMPHAGHAPQPNPTPSGNT